MKGSLIMRAKVEAVFIGLEQNTFTDSKTKEVVEYRRATFNVRGTSETFVLGVPKDVDASKLVQYTDSFLIVDFRYQQNQGSYKGRLVSVLSDAKSLASAPLFDQKSF